MMQANGYLAKPRSLVAYALATLLITTCCALLATVVLPASPAYAAKFNPTLVQVSDNRSISEPGFLNVQGAAFDTYTQTDGYSFAQGTNGKKNFKLIHFTMDANGNIAQVKSLKYKKANVGHANDATVYQKGTNKYLFVAVSGGLELSSKASNGKKAKVGLINLGEYEKGVAKVYAVTVKAKSGVGMSTSIAKAPLSGITYTGDRQVDGKLRPVFVMKSGGMLYAAYLTGSGNKLKLTIFSSSHVNKPSVKIGSKKYEGTFQGITYHNGYIYFPLSGETSEKLHNSYDIARVKYSTLFAAKTVNNGTQSMQICYKRTTKAQGQKLARHIPESLFFRTLEGKDNMYVSFNRATTATRAPDIDAVLRSNQKY